MSTRRTTLDRLFSQVVRERADWTCESCGTQFEVRAPNLHCSHFRSRRYNGTRWHPINAAAHCATCHRFFSDHPHIFGAWIKDHLGEDGLEALIQLSNRVTKFTDEDRRAIRDALKKILSFLKDKRSDGVRGRIEIDWEKALGPR